MRAARVLFASGIGAAFSAVLAFGVFAQPAARTGKSGAHRATDAGAAPTVSGSAPAPAIAAGRDGGRPTVDGGRASAADSSSLDGGADLAASGGVHARDASTAMEAIMAPPVPPKNVRKGYPPPPPPTREMVANLETLQAAALTYEKGARDYRDVITQVIQIHYEQKKKEIFSVPDNEIAIEKSELKKARENAIVRLEQFVARYSGSRSHPEATPDAMYRLAALYEERARGEDAKDDSSVALKPAIALYKRIIREFGNYRELAGVHYFLGHAYNDSGRTEEAQQVWRSLVCRNHYGYPTNPDPRNSDVDTVLPLPQDKPESEWIMFRKRYPTPESLVKSDPDTKFVDPYPQDCKPMAQPALIPGSDLKYVAEIWWQIGNWEFDQLDYGGGRVLSRDEPDLVAMPAAYDFNRAASAYTHSLQFRKPPLYGVSLYKYAWALFKQQRYDAATREFVHLLLYTDEQQSLTGDPGADFRGEAYTYIAGSLTNYDFKGPEADEPFIPRPDIVDMEPNPTVVEQKLHVAIDRVSDPTLIPQDKPWTIEIYKALGLEFRSLNQFNNAVDIYAIILRRWPMDPSAPDIQAAVAETYDQMGATKHPGTAEHEAAAAKALEARTALANYIDNTPWVLANKDNPAAIQNAEHLVKGGLRLAAVQHTNNGRSALQEAGQSGDTTFVIERLQRALAEYRLASFGWLGFLHQDENSPDAYESRYWLADSRRQVVRIQVLLHKIKRDQYPEPTAKEIAEAKAAAIDVRESNEDDRYIDNASLWVVDITDVRRDLEYQRFDDTQGEQGVEQRKELKFAGEPPDRKVVRDPVPAVVIDSIRTRDEYVERVPSNLDVNHNAIAFLYYSAEVLFLYGRFDEAKARFEPMYKEHCGKDEYGYKAWEKLITMSNSSGDVEHSRQLAEAEKNKSCAMNAEQKAKGALIVNPTLQEAAYVRAREKFKLAQDAPKGDEKDKLWREAAGLYEAALSAAPARDEAPEAAMNAAFAYKQVGDFSKAIQLYNKFIDEYGSEARLGVLDKGDPKTKAAPDPKKYKERLGYLNDAYDALSNTYFGFFNYQRAAETYDKIASIERFEVDKRRSAARNAMVLYSKMGQRERMMVQYRLLLKLSPTPEEKANVDYLVANYEFVQWNAQGSDTGVNRTTRQAAEVSLTAFFSAAKGSSVSTKYAVEAAYQMAKLKKAGGDSSYHAWLNSTIATWQTLKGQPATGGKDAKPDALTPPYADYAAEAEYTLLDEEIREKYDYETGHHRYAGAVEEIVGKVSIDKAGKKTVVKKGKYQTDAEDADKYDLKLQHITDTYPSIEWVPAAIARKGTLYDSLRTGLYNTVPPALKFFTPAQEALLKQLENSGRDERIEQADNLRTAVKEGWRHQKDLELAGSDEVMVRNYAAAIALAEKYSVKNASVQHAMARMAYYTDIVGDAKMRMYVEKTKDPTDPAKQRMLTYTDNLYVQSRAGLTTSPAPSGFAAPAPVAP